jgi:hypothetical protein
MKKYCDVFTPAEKIARWLNVLKLPPFANCSLNHQDRKSTRLTTHIYPVKSSKIQSEGHPVRNLNLKMLHYHWWDVARRGKKALARHKVYAHRVKTQDFKFYEYAVTTTFPYA